MRLGCIHDTPDRIARHAPHVCGAAPMPVVLNRVLPPVGLYRNDVLNDCVVAAVANSLRTASMLATGADRATTEDAVLAAFAGFANVPLAAVGAVPGLTPLDVLEAILTGGFAAGGPAPESFRTLRALSSRAAIEDAVLHLGSAMCAVDLYGDDDLMPWIDAPSGDLIGGHMVLVRRWTTDGPLVATWGTERAASWEWLITRLRAGWGVDWVIEKV